jgi:hypothetical protein
MDDIETKVMIERGGVFMYPTNPIRTADGEPFSVPEASAGRVFNAINVRVWMKTLMMCCHRSGYNHISDDMRSNIMDYIKHAMITIVDTIESPQMVVCGMRIVIPRDVFMFDVPGCLFYRSTEEPPCMFPRESITGGPQLVYAIISGMREYRIEVDTPREELAYYEKALRKFVLDYPQCRHLETIRFWLRVMSSWKRSLNSLKW